MLYRRSKLILITCLLIGIPFLVWRAIGILQVIKIAGDNREQLPVRTFRITIDPKQQQELFGQFQEFAKQNGFRIEISDYGSGGGSYQVWMLRDDIKIIASHTQFDRDLVSLSFYDETLANSVSEETLVVIDDLFTDLESKISEIADVTITEESDRIP